jgi:glycosyltransferase involved in cell wall biosynthesis
MEIAFLVGSPEISGGTYVIYEHAARLQRLGHTVTIITQETACEEQYSWHSSAGELGWLNLEQAAVVHFDIVLATWWQSPFLLKDLDFEHGVYFVQSIETRFFEAVEPTDYGAQDHDIWQQLCEKTYSYALPMITEARWIQEYLYENYNNRPFLVRNGIRKDIYTAVGEAVSPQVAGKLRVLLEGPVDVPYKNVPRSIELAREAGADEIWLLTSSAVSEVAGVDRVFSRVAIHDTPPIFRSCDVLLKLSYVEGMFGPPLEMFHCGGTAIVYRVTGHDEYLVDDENSLVVDRDDEAGIVNCLRRLKDEPATLARLKEGGRQTAGQWPDWDECSRKFEFCLQEIAGQHRTSLQYLKRYTKELLDLSIPLTREKVLQRFLQREKNIARSKPTEQHNFVEFYWHSEDNFKSENMEWVYYQSEEWATVSFDVQISGFPFWLRLDPSVRVGFVELEYITVCNTDTDREIQAFKDPDDFAVLFLSGSAYWIDHEKKNIIFSFGPDPAMVLPSVTEENCSIGDNLHIEMRLRETGVQQFFREYTLKLRQEQPLMPEPAPALPTPWYRKIAAKIAGK